MELHRISDDVRAELERSSLDPDEVEHVVTSAIVEDLAGGDDVTSAACIDPDQVSVATFAARESGALCGIDVARAAMEVVIGASDLDFEYLVRDGERIATGAQLARLRAPTRLILTGERTALNLLCHLSGVASLTATWVDAIEGTGARIRDTRKTTPGLRALEKYAVRCGGGVNHRMSLSDAVLIKDNHVAAAGGVVRAFELVRAHSGDLPIEVEVDTLEQLRAVIEAGADLVLLDNMSLDELRASVDVVAEYRRATGRDVVLEASGVLSLGVARDVAMTGVDFLSVGALTHSAPILDIGLDS